MYTKNKNVHQNLQNICSFCISFCRWHVTGDLDTNYHNVLTGLQEAEVDLGTLYGFRCVKISKV